MRRAAVAVATTAMAVSLAACGSAKEADGGSDSSDSAAKKGDDIKVGLLLPENQTARYEKFDKPMIEK
ncbi:ABC transporter substrate-binding protein, partial [Streptomyces sp. NPDC058783]